MRTGTSEDRGLCVCRIFVPLLQSLLVLSQPNPTQVEMSGDKRVSVGESSSTGLTTVVVPPSSDVVSFRTSYSIARAQDVFSLDEVVSESMMSPEVTFPLFASLVRPETMTQTEKLLALRRFMVALMVRERPSPDLKKHQLDGNYIISNKRRINLDFSHLIEQINLGAVLVNGQPIKMRQFMRSFSQVAAEEWEALPPTVRAKVLAPEWIHPQYLPLSDVQRTLDAYIPVRRAVVSSAPQGNGSAGVARHHDDTQQYQ